MFFSKPPKQPAEQSAPAATTRAALVAATLGNVCTQYPQRSARRKNQQTSHSSGGTAGITSVAYDAAQSLLATGWNDGSILISGSPVKNIEVRLQCESSHGSATGSLAISHLAFKTGERYLAAINEVNELFMWNLMTRTLQFPPLQIGCQVTSITVPSACGWVFVGLATGQVLIFDVLRGSKSDYSIPCPADVIENSETTQTSTHEPLLKNVVALELSPTDSHSLLIAYAYGLVVIWDIKANAIAKKMTLLNTHIDEHVKYPKGKISLSRVLSNKSSDERNHQRHKSFESFRSSKSATMGSQVTNDGSVLSDDMTRVTAACWRPDGKYVITGHDSYFAFWKVKDSGGILNAFNNHMKKDDMIKPMAVRALLLEESENSTPHCIQGLAWAICPSNDNESECMSFLFIQSHEDIYVYNFTSSKDYKLGKVHMGLHTETPISQFCLIHSSQTDPNAIIICTNGTTEAYTYNIKTPTFSQCHISPSLTFQATSTVLSFTTTTTSKSYLTNLRNLFSSETSPTSQPLLTGGTMTLHTSHGDTTTVTTADEPISEIFATLHRDASLCLWTRHPHPRSSPSPYTFLTTVPLTDLITLTSRPSNSGGGGGHDEDDEGIPRPRVWFDAGGRVVLLVSGANVVVVRFGGCGVVTEDGDELFATREEMDVLMERLDRVVDEALEGFLPVFGADENLGGVVDGKKDEEKEEEEVDVKAAKDVDGTVESGPGLEVKGGENNHEAAKETSDISESMQPSGLNEVGKTESHIVVNATVAVDKLWEYTPAIKNAWYPIVREMHMQPVVMSKYSSWLNVIASATNDATLTLVDVITGHAILTEGYGCLSDGSPIDIIFIDFFETYFEKETETRPVMITATSHGACYMYPLTIDPATPFHPRRITSPPLPRQQLLKPSKTETRTSSWDPVLACALLDEEGHILQTPIVGIQAGGHAYSHSRGSGKEQYLVLACRWTLRVMLMESGKGGRVVSEVAFGGGIFNGWGLLSGMTGMGHGVGDGGVVCARVVGLKKGPCVVTVDGKGCVKGYVLPGLEECSGVGIGDGWNCVEILGDGRIAVWDGDKGIIVHAGMADVTLLPVMDVKVYDVIRQNAWIKARGGSTVSKAPSEKELNDLFGGRRHIEEPSTTDEHGTASLSNTLGDAKNKLNERGERLANLEEKFGQLSSGSATFLQTIREYNAKQEKKKWWEL